MTTHSNILWAGKLLLLAGVAALGLANVGRAQCCNNGSMGIEYGAPMIIGEMVDPAAELIEPDDPAKTINLTIVVPEKALVKVNNEPTFTKGVVRQYVIRGLKPGKKYKFVVQAEYVNEHQAVYKAEKTLTLDSGSSERVALPLHRVERPKPPAPGAPPALPAAAAI